MTDTVANEQQTFAWTGTKSDFGILCHYLDVE